MSIRGIVENLTPITPGHNGGTVLNVPRRWGGIFSSEVSVDFPVFLVLSLYLNVGCIFPN